MSQSSGQQTQQQTSQSAPWAPTQPLLRDLVGQIGNQNTGVTPLQQQASVNYTNAAGGLPNFAPQTGNIANLLLSGAPNLNQNLQNAFQTYQSQLQPFTNQQNLNPLNTPGLGTALQYMQNQVHNNIAGEFAGAGRDLSPAETQAEAYGQTGALAPLIMGQYNTNAQNYLGSVGGLYQGANQLNSGLLGNIGAGTNLASGVPAMATQPALTQLAAANQGYNLPFANIGSAENLTLPIAGLGGQTMSQGTSNYSLTPSVLSDISQGTQAFSNLFNPFSGGANSGFAGFTKLFP